MVLPVIAGLAGAAITGALANRGASKAADAQRAASEDQIRFARDQFESGNALSEDLYGRNLSDIEGAYGDIFDAYGSAYDDAYTNADRYRDDAMRYGAAARGEQIGKAKRTADQQYADIGDTYDLSRADIGRGYRNARAGLQPYEDAGTNSLAAYLSNLGLGDAPEGYTGLGMSDFADFRLREGVDAIEGGAAGRGDLYSGRTLKALEDRRQDIATEDRALQMNRLAGLADMGRGVASEMGGLDVGQGQDYANLNQGALGDRMGVRGSTDAILRDLAAQRGADKQRISADYANMRNAADQNYYGNMANAYQNQLGNQLNASNNRFTAYTNAASPYQQNTLTSMANYGDAGAAGAIGGANAWTGAINNGLGIYGAMGGNPSQWSNPFGSSGWSANNHPLASVGTPFNNWAR